MGTNEENRSTYRWQVQLLLFVVVLLFSACGDELPATVTAMPTVVPLLPTVAATITPPTADAAPDSLLAEPTVEPMITANVAMTTPLTLTATLPLTVGGNITAAAAVTVSELSVPLTNTAGQLVTETVLLTDIVSTETCAIANDVALLSYPDIHTYLGCALAEASFDPVAINEFGAGPAYDRFMLWFGSENQIYVLQPNKTWQVYADNWTEDQPTFTCNPLAGEATSPPLPRRGFGKIWCTVEGLQATMGSIEREERLCQHTVTQSFAHGRLLACYEDATIRFFRIMDDGTWDQMLTQ